MTSHQEEQIKRIEARIKEQEDFKKKMKLKYRGVSYTKTN